MFSSLLDEIPVEYLDDRLPRPLRASFAIPFFSFFSLFHITYPFLLPLLIRHREYRVIISHNSYTTFTAWTLSKTREIPYFMLVWDPIVYILEKAYRGGPIRRLRSILRPIGRWLDSSLLNSAAALILASESHAEYLRGLERKAVPTLLVPPGCDSAEALPPRREEYVLTVTAWKPGKQLEILLRAMENLSDARLVVAGEWVDADYRANIEGLISLLGLADRVTVVGPLSEEALTELYRGARITVICNAERGFGLPALEAAAQGSPFACPPTCGVARYVAAHDGALYFDEGDEAALERIMARLLSDERVAYDLGRRAWKRVREALDWSAQADALHRGIMDLVPDA